MSRFKEIADLLIEVRGGPQRQRYRAGLSEVPHQQDFRRQARAFGAGPHDKPDPEEGTKKDVMSAQEKLAKLKAMEKTATGLQLGKIKAFIARLSQENQSMEINMTGYERIYEMLINEGTPSHKAPGHKERMDAHKKRIRSHPEYEESKKRGNEKKKDNG